MAILAAATLGCAGTNQESAEASAEGSPDLPSDPRSAGQLQQAIMDFSDQYVSALWLALDQYIDTEPDPARRTSAQRWKVMLGSASMTIAASQDPRDGLLDMAVFISAGRWALSHYWIPEVLGERAAPLRKVYKEMDDRIWEEAAEVLTPDQVSDLKGLIAAWVATRPPRNELLDVRLRNLDGVELENFAEQKTARGLVASIKRLLGKVDKSLLYGERVLFYMERVPRILAQQSDLTIDTVAERFPIATINPDFSEITELADNLPQHITDVLNEQKGFVAESLPEVRKSIESAERITLSLQQTFDSVNSLATRLEALPMDADDYSMAWEKASSTLGQLERLVTGLNQLIDSTSSGKPRATELVGLVDDRANQLLDKAFQRALVLIAVFFTGILICLFAARRLFRKPPGHTGKDQDKGPATT